MANKKSKKEDGVKAGQGSTRTRLIKPMDNTNVVTKFQPYSKAQQVGKKPTAAPKGGRR
jgi:hypothetical protein